MLTPLFALLSVVACWAPEMTPAGDGGAADPGLVFVEGGVVVPGEVGADGISLSEGRVLVATSWTPGQPFELLGQHLRVEQVAPAVPACALLFRVGVGGDEPSAVLFLEQGAVLRVDRGSQGPLRVDAWRGEPRAAPLDATAEEEIAAVEPVQLPASCAAEARSGPALRLADGRVAVVEGPIVERSGETGWRVAVFR